jgi:hypothetical protein
MPGDGNSTFLRNVHISQPNYSVKSQQIATFGHPVHFSSKPSLHNTFCFSVKMYISWTRAVSFTLSHYFQGNRPGTHSTGGSVSPRASLVVTANTKISCPYRQSNLGTPRSLVDVASELYRLVNVTYVMYTQRAHSVESITNDMLTSTIFKRE